MKALSAFYPMVLPYVMGCPNPMLDQALLYAAGTFCRDTNAVQHISTYHVIAGQEDYCVETPSGSVFCSVLSVWYADRPLKPVGIDEVLPGMAMRDPFGAYTAAAGTPTCFYQKTPASSEISLWPVPDVALSDGLATRVAYEPSATATSLDDTLYATYGADIAFGAIAYLMMLPGQAFSNPLLGKAFQRRFDDAIEGAKITAKLGRVRRSARVRLRSYV